MKDPLRIAIAGLGTVGSGLVRILRESADLLAERAGRPVVITAVSARTRQRERGLEIEALRWENDPVALAGASDVDVVVELMGGAEGPALELVRRSLSAGKQVVTANKALLAHHGRELAELAEARGVALKFEGAVAGGIPIIKTLREALIANRVSRVYGILNGTCNFILTEMEASGRGFEEVLAQAQALGYAEADPTFDIGGMDAAQKLALLSSLAFGTEINLGAVRAEGISDISLADIAYARELGFRIKLLAIASTIGEGVEQRVHAAMVPATSPIARIDGVTNAVMIEGDRIGALALEGPGAGAGATASAVAADIADIARGQSGPPFILPVAKLRRAPPVALAARPASFYIRLSVTDRPGVMAAVTHVLAERGVSIESLIQRGRAPGETVSVVLTTHECEEGVLRSAVAAIARLDAVQAKPVLIRIEPL